MYFCAVASLFALAAPVASQSITEIYDIWSTQWDRSTLFTYTNLGSNPIAWNSPGAVGQADISVDDSQLLQDIVGFGASLTDSSALTLNNLKSQNSGNYWNLLTYLFDPTDANQNAGLSYIRVPLGASDFSASGYTFDDVSGDTSLNSFNINNAPSYLFSVLSDIKGINPNLKIHILPWSPPGWMKDSGSINGGSFLSQYINTYANYLLKSLQGFQSKGFTIYAIGIQNEPENSDSTYPSCLLSASQEAQIGTALRTLMDNNGFSSTRIIGFEHNWSDAGGYPEQVIQQASSAFAGVSFHCYAGSVTDQETFHNAYPDKEIYFTECTGTYGSDWWSDIKWYMDNLFIGAPQNNAMNALMWNLALDGNGNPKYPGTDSCGSPGCRPVVTVNSDGSYSVNQEFYSMAQAQKAINPKDSGGPFGQRIGVSVTGSLDWGLIVGAYVTGRANPSDWNRYSLVVLNWDDQPNGSWDPTPITTTIEFRGYQATYTFPVGVTTLTWYAPSNGATKRSVNETSVPTERAEEEIRVVRHPHAPPTM
ncbi:glycoside hydrolase family 30 protein [Gelatoporia subvermispora B]|uniref:Glycoside hydrolase family 30 protein n=1 Tax=Ceriporiopsis subvermispora (strain B) TaxID=914234 RepID=M2RLR1_CERS8|nr:glycoside hydrolase family 30 protein [Gelatoporia subvermispora B]